MRHQYASYSPRPDSKVSVRSAHIAVILLITPILIILCGVELKAQTYLQDVGTPTFTTSLPVENGFMNVANGNLHLEIPFGTFPQRGAFQGKHVLAYDGAIWSNNGSVWSPSNTPPPMAGYSIYPGPWQGWRFIFSFMGGVYNYSQASTVCPQDGKTKTIQYSNFIWNSPDGASHTFPIQTSHGYQTACGTGPDQPNGGSLASDASGFYMNVGYYTYALITGPDGVIVGYKDTNGNIIGNGIPPYTDTIGRSMPVVTNPSNDNRTFAVSISDSQGTSTYTVKTATINVATKFNVPGITEYSGSAWVVTEVDLPDGTKYSFKYDCDSSSGPACGSPTGQGAYYGLLTSMALPTGGQINYTWSIFKDAYGNPYPWLTARSTAGCLLTLQPM